jgi:signal peptide peptidase SppA
MKIIQKIFKRGPIVNVIRLSGVIAEASRFGGGALNDTTLAPLLERAFRKGKPKAVAIALNSPGGSPVQSSLIGTRIRRLSEELDVPVYAFCEDVAASGGYWLACAADEIYVDDSSIIGSIGVISASFGFHELMKKQGVERRVHTAGQDKSMLDPFRPERPADVKRLKALQKKIHDNFIAHVQSRRGGNLIEDDLFTGEVWVGEDAVKNGLVDGVAHLEPKMKQMFGENIRLNAFGQKKSFFKRLGLGGSVNMLSSVEERVFWSQFGL